MPFEKEFTGDRSLGMDSAITRRDFLESTLLASGAALLCAASPAQLLEAQARNGSAAAEFNGFGGVGEYATSNGNTWDVLSAGHKIRDGVFRKGIATAQKTGEHFDYVMLGSGGCGRDAALFCARRSCAQ